MVHFVREVGKLISGLKVKYTWLIYSSVVNFWSVVTLFHR